MPIVAPQIPESLGLCAGKLHHLRPLLRFRFNERAELRGRHRHRRAAKIDQAALELRISEGRVDSLFSFSTTAAGVLFGAPIPNHAVAS